MNVEDIEGIGKTEAGKLEKAGVKTVDDLLRAGAKPGGRDKLAEATGLSPKNILKLVRRLPSLSEVERWVSEAKTLDKVVTH